MSNKLKEIQSTIDDINLSIRSLDGLNDMISNIDRKVLQRQLDHQYDVYHRNRLAIQREELIEEYKAKILLWTSDLGSLFKIRFSNFESTGGGRLRTFIKYQDHEIEISHKAYLKYSDGSKTFLIHGYDNPTRKSHWNIVWNTDFGLSVTYADIEDYSIVNKTELLEAISKSFSYLIFKDS